MDKLMITVALVGAEVSRKDTPHLPITPEEIGEAAAEACAAGAAIAHVHVRDADGNPSQSREMYRQAIDEIQKRCNIIVQVSTGGAVGMTAEERLQPVSLSPEMATLTTGTVNFSDEVFMNSPEQLHAFAEEFTKYGVKPEFEIFDVGMIENALRLVKKGYFPGHNHFDFVMGVPGAIPATPENLLHMTRQIPQDSTWSVAAMGRFQLPMATLAIIFGGHVRVGLEDNIYYTKGVLATNTQLVERIVRISKELQRGIASPDEARRRLGLLVI